MGLYIYGVVLGRHFGETYHLVGFIGRAMKHVNGDSIEPVTKVLVWLSPVAH